ncbi:MAG: HAD-IC family P-type ATPase [Spirochaetaceae bacterium]|nr:HAD-IC family P-type ATPase [Spirochaetaceae bacterium]
MKAVPSASPDVAPRQHEASDNAAKIVQNSGLGQPQAAFRHESIQGLTESEATRRRREFGENILPTAKGPSAFSTFISQFKSPLVYIILAAAIISLIVGEVTDFFIIMVVVVIDAIVGFLQEYQAQKTYSSLKNLLKPTTTVIRDGLRREIELRELVPGDVAVLNAGERVPGDGQIIEGVKLSVDEAILTGESEPVGKKAEAGSDRAFMGTTVLTGRGLMTVSGTGTNTELGAIATSLKEDVQEETPLQTRLKAFSKTLTWLVLGVTAAILIVGLVSGRPFLEMLRVSIVLAIAAIPEGLLIAVTVILVIGMRKILKRNGLVKKLLAVETLGSVTTICTDKTGTLTEGRMRVTRQELAVPDRALEAMVLCNDMEGPVEAALWEFAAGMAGSGAPAQAPQAIVDRSERMAVELFSSETKYMITADRIDGEERDYLKGAPEIILAMCNIEQPDRERLLSLADNWAGDGLRLIGLASRPHSDIEVRNGYTWAGLVAMEDPIREGVQESVEIAHKAGIKVKMITGDYRKTAERIARSCGIIAEGEEVLDGSEMEKLDDAALAERVGRVAVFSRIRPHDKLRIVRALQSKDEVVAMVGDGVNDAPALKRSNIGIVVGSATDVARETADLVLLDSNFRTIVAAVEEGRTVFQNIRKVVAYTLSNSFAEVFTIFGAMLLGWPAPLAVAQILWIHLICDGPSDIVLGFEPKEDGIMEEKPLSVKEPILNSLGLSLIAIISTASAAAGLILFGHYYNVHGSIMQGQSFAFASFAVNSMIYIFAYRSMRRPLFRSGRLSRNKPLIFTVLGGLALAILPFCVPGIGKTLGVEPLAPSQWGIVFAVAFGLLTVVEIGKFVSNRFIRRS